MGVSRKNPFTEFVLFALDLDVPLIPLESPYDFLKRRKGFKRNQYLNILNRLKKSKVIEIVEKNNIKFIRVTKAGSLKILLKKAQIQKSKAWDGKWRVLMFDIPEAFRSERDKFRRILLNNGFVKLQASVFICPYDMSPEAVLYLKDSSLIDFVRIMRVDKIDFDLKLKKTFDLK